jgi:hypothetical protein
MSSTGFPRDRSDQGVAVVIPAYNEAGHIGDGVRSVPSVLEVGG